MAKNIKIFDKNGKPLHLGDVINEISPETLDRIVEDLNEFGVEYNRYEYGLPNYGDTSKEMRQIVMNALNSLIM